MNLHRAEQAEWENIPVESRNKWQHIAARTHGLVTPGNAVSTIGLGLVIAGLVDMHKGKHKRGITKLVVGRACDLVDGYAADKTGTKSPTGEMVDATFDKIAMAAVLIATAKETQNKGQAAAFGVQNIANAVLSIVSRSRGKVLHPSAAGKITAATQWIAISSGLMYGMASRDKKKKTRSVTKTINTLSAAVAIGLGAYATIKYAEEVYRKNAPKEDQPSSENDRQL